MNNQRTSDSYGIQIDESGCPTGVGVEMTTGSELRSLFDRLDDLDRERRLILRKIVDHHIGFQPEKLPVLLKIYLEY